MWFWGGNGCQFSRTLLRVSHGAPAVSASARANSSSLEEWRVVFQAVIGYCLKPTQTCWSTCGYLFRTLQLKSCFPLIIGRIFLRDAQTCGCTRNFLFSSQFCCKGTKKIGIITIFLLKSWYYTNFSWQNLTLCQLSLDISSHFPSQLWCFSTYFVTFVLRKSLENVKIRLFIFFHLVKDGELLFLHQEKAEFNI